MKQTWQTFFTVEVFTCMLAHIPQVTNCCYTLVLQLAEYIRKSCTRHSSIKPIVIGTNTYVKLHTHGPTHTHIWIIFINNISI